MRRLLRNSGVYLLVFLCLAALPAQATPQQSNTPEFDRLLSLLEQRLQLMRGVAAYKYAKDIAIENKQREQVVLASAIASARQQQLDAASIEAFFRLQIELAKTVQEGWIESWKADGRRA